MKKNLLTLTASAIMILTLASCGSTGTASSAPESSASGSSSAQASRNTNATAWQIPDAGFDTTKDVEINFYSTMGDTLQETFNVYLEEFNKLYPNIHITHTQPGGYDDVLDQVSTELSVGEGPDITYCYSDHVALYNKTKAVVTLDNLIYDDELGFTSTQYNDFIQGYYKEGASFGDGLMYTLPWSKSTEVLYYNVDVFNELSLSLPTHWFSTGATDTTSMEYVCEKLKAAYPDSAPLGYDSESNWFITMTEQLQTPYTSATGEHFLFNTAENKEFMQKFHGWYEKGYFTTSQIYGNYTSGLFTEQTSFMSIGSSAGATHQVPSKSSDGTYPFEVGIAEIPQANDANKKVISQGPSVCILNHGDDQKIMASWLFMKYFTTSTAFQAQFSIDSGYVPVLKSVSEDPTYQEHLAQTSSPLTQDVKAGEDGYWYIRNRKTDTWEKSETAIEYKTNDEGTQYAANNPGVDQKAKISALSAKVCLEQEENYFTSPAFIGSSIARTQVGNLFVQYMTDKAGLDEAFEDAIKTCEANI